MPGPGTRPCLAVEKHWSNGSISRQTEYVHKFWYSLVLQKCNSMTWKYQRNHMLCKMCWSSFDVCSWALIQIRFEGLRRWISKTLWCINYVMYTDLSHQNIVFIEWENRVFQIPSILVVHYTEKFITGKAMKKT